MIMGAFVGMLAALIAAISLASGVHWIGAVYIYLASTGALICIAGITYRVVTRNEEDGP